MIPARIYTRYGSSPLVRGQPRRPDHRRAAPRIIPARAGPTSRASVSLVSSQDHPRSCGANHLYHSGKCIYRGSSPLVRGQLRVAIRVLAVHRIIPARAGPTIIRIMRIYVKPDHPRSCGANDLVQSAVELSCGSSPLVRGQQSPTPTRLLRLRIIPARAGPTLRMKSESRTSPDHPRSCGANGHVERFGQVPAGSSPLVRGQLPDQRDHHPQRRIIPARAGPTV